MHEVVEIDPQGEHQFVVRLRLGDEVAESWFRLSSALLEEWGVTDEEDFVRKTVVYLLRHQEIADFPDIVELEDVIATYDDYLDSMRATAGR